MLAEFLSNLQECKQLAADAHHWFSAGPHGGPPIVSQVRRDQMTEAAFLRAFLSWESFIEESFVLYLSGQRPPRGRAPRRYAYPPTYHMAAEWVVPEGRPYASWANAAGVSTRAERFFKDGRPFAPVLRANLSLFDEARTIRNAIAHKSADARQKFETLVRNKLGTLPPNLTVGSFLGMTAPGSAPPVSFLEHYVSKIDFVARRIVRS